MRRGTEVDRVIARLAASNPRVVTWVALEAAGVGRRAVAHRVAIERLYRIHRGVYLLESPTEAGRITLLTAAVAACGENAVLSHRSAAELWGLLAHHPGEIDVTIVARSAGERPGIRRHRVATLEALDIRTRRGIRVTAPARTALDASADLGRDDAEELLANALSRNLATERQVLDAISRCPTRRGAPRLLAILRQEGGPRWTRSEGERRILSLIRQAGLPVPRTNTQLHGYDVDAVWSDHRLVVEVDGYDFHRDRAAFENDRARDATHVAAGYRVVRFTAVQLRDQPLIVVGRLAAALALTAPQAAA
jgi:very-short-patch-repair endonuclease